MWNIVGVRLRQRVAVVQHLGCRLPVKPKEEEEAAELQTVEDGGSRHGSGEKHGGTRPPQKS